MYRSLIENAGEAILVARDDRVIFANPRAEELFGWTQHDLAARPIAEFIHTEDRDTMMRQYEKLLRSEQTFRVPPFRIVDRSDNIKWVRLRAALFSTDTNPAVFFFLTDMTRRINTEQELRRSEEKYRRVIDTTSGGYILMDPHFLIIDVNRSLLQMLGCGREELIGKLPYTLYDKKSVMFYFANQDHISFEAQFAVKGGREITLLYNRSTLRDEKGGDHRLRVVPVGSAGVEARAATAASCGRTLPSGVLRERRSRDVPECALPANSCGPIPRMSAFWGTTPSKRCWPRSMIYPLSTFILKTGSKCCRSFAKRGSAGKLAEVKLKRKDGQPGLVAVQREVDVLHDGELVI